MIIRGDANEDCRVDYLDLGILATNYGHTGTTWGQGDFDGDGAVTYLDLGTLATTYDFGKVCCGGEGAVPEPGLLALLAAAGAGVLCRRRR